MAIQTMMHFYGAWVALPRLSDSTAVHVSFWDECGASILKEHQVVQVYFSSSDRMGLIDLMTKSRVPSQFWSRKHGPKSSGPNHLP